MEELVIGVRFKKTGKLCYYDPLKYKFKLGDNIIAKTDRGQEIGRVVKIFKKEELNPNIEVNKIIKPATKKDLEQQKENENKAKEALDFCRKEVKKENLNMKILSAEYTFDLSKLTIYFVSEERVDFRELVKLLASKYKVRIELRQIGPRDEVKEFATLGMCGKEVCCRTFLQNFDPVTIKMAKEQGLQINMSKLSGACGKLMCCLKYEEEVYEELNKKLPNVGDIISTVDGTGEILSTNVLMQVVKAAVRKSENDAPTIGFYAVDEIKVIKRKKKAKQESESELEKLLGECYDD